MRAQVLALCGRPLVRLGEPSVASANAAGSTGGIAIEGCVCAACVRCRESAGWAEARKATDIDMKMSSSTRVVVREWT